MSLPHELKFLGTLKGQVATIVTLLLLTGGFVGFIVATLPAAASGLNTTHALKLSLMPISEAPTRKDYTMRKDYDSSDDSVVLETYQLKANTAILIYYSKTASHANFMKLLRRAQYAAAEAGVKLMRFDCSIEKPSHKCEDSYEVRARG